MKLFLFTTLSLLISAAAFGSEPTTSFANPNEFADGGKCLAKDVTYQPFCDSKPVQQACEAYNLCYWSANQMTHDTDSTLQP